MGKREREGSVKFWKDYKHTKLVKQSKSMRGAQKLEISVVGTTRGSLGWADCKEAIKEFKGRH